MFSIILVFKYNRTNYANICVRAVRVYCWKFEGDNENRGLNNVQNAFLKRLFASYFALRTNT